MRITMRITKNWKTTLLLFGLGSLAVGQAWAGALPATKLQKLVDGFVQQGATGAVLYVKQGPRPAVLLTSGHADSQTKRPMSGRDPFRIASISKAYISALMVKLHVEGRLNLYDPITKHLPRELSELIPYADQILLRNLLDHSSGIYDYRDEDFTRDALQDPFRYRHEKEELLRALRKRNPPCAKPGDLNPKNWTCPTIYSNSNTVLAGMILDSVLGRHHSHALYEELLRPLGLRDTVYEKHLLPWQKMDRQRLVHGYFTFPGENAPRDVTDADDGNGFANGGLIATAEDVGRFFEALFSSKSRFPMKTWVGKSRFLREMLKVNALNLAPGNMKSGGFRMHAGTISGYTGVAKYSMNQDLTIVFLTNDRDFESQKYELIDAVEKVLKKEKRKRRKQKDIPCQSLKTMSPLERQNVLSCKTSKGYRFERMEAYRYVKERQVGESLAWKGEDGTIWLEEPQHGGRLDYDAARESCQQFGQTIFDWSIATKELFERAERQGIRELLPMADKWIWTSTSTPWNESRLYFFSGQNGRFGHSHRLSGEHYYWCVRG